ncbi:TPA: hypothetical protein NGS83_004531 [Vibrio parahaemolyticus]|nr:hypothetical protein [Vibrio parahaemolyticus]
MRPKVEIDIDIPSCNHFGINPQSFSDLLKDNLVGEYELVINCLYNGNKYPNRYTSIIPDGYSSIHYTDGIEKIENIGLTVDRLFKELKSNVSS